MDSQMSNLWQMMQAMRQSGPAAPDGYNKGMPPQMMFEMLMPYMPPHQQKRMSSLRQAMELKESLTEYALQAWNQQAQGGPDWRHAFLISIQPHLPPQKRRVIEALIKLIEVSDIMREIGGSRYEY